MRCSVTVSKQDKNTRAVARKLLSKLFPAVTNMRATVEVLLDYNNWSDVFYEVRAEML
jgi:hypothetical protein